MTILYRFWKGIHCKTLLDLPFSKTLNLNLDHEFSLLCFLFFFLFCLLITLLFFFQWLWLSLTTNLSKRLRETRLKKLKLSRLKLEGQGQEACPSWRQLGSSSFSHKPGCHQEGESKSSRRWPFKKGKGGAGVDCYSFHCWASPCFSIHEGKRSLLYAIRILIPVLSSNFYA